MRWTNLNFLLLQLLSIFASVNCFEEHDWYPFSEVINSGMENDTNPCNNFQQYTCGKWIARNEIPDIFKEWNIDGMTQLSFLILMKEILENPNIDESNKELSVEKKFYKACIDEDYSPKEGAKLLSKMLNETPQTSWQDVVKYYATKFSAFDLFHIKLTENNYLQIQRPHFSESNKRPFLDIIHEITEGVSEVDDNNIDTQLRIKRLDESLHFIAFVNKITLDGQKDIQKVFISDLQALYDNHCPSKHAKIEWLQFFDSLAIGTLAVFKRYSRIKVDVQYLKDLCEQLSKTPQHAIVTYLRYNLFFNKDMISYFTTDFNEMSYTQRYIHCIRKLKITEGITKEIIKSHVPKKSQKIVQEMFNNIKTAVIKEIENSWLVNSVKEVVLKRARGITYKYGLVKDPLRKKFGKTATYEFKVGRVAFQNELNMRRAQIINILQVYNNTYKSHRAKRYLVCNAYYFRDKNELVIGIPMMFPTYIYKNGPIGFNYGRLGFIIGHEISHAFDSEILQYFIDCIPSGYEKDMMKVILENRINCFVTQFNNLKIDGFRTLDENVADTQGLKLAWKAMNAVIRDKETKDKELPNFEDWDQKELFFLSFANQWCSNPEYKEDDGEDEHAPHGTRILGTLNNMNEFAETYDCTSGETMNPLMKCDLWANSSRTGSQYMFKKSKKYFK